MGVFVKSNVVVRLSLAGTLVAGVSSLVRLGVSSVSGVPSLPAVTVKVIAA
jgi:hypothetical protein